MSALKDKLPLRAAEPSRIKPVRRGQRTWVPVLIGAVVLAIVVYCLSLGVLAVNGIPGASYYRVDAVFGESDNVVKHNKVRVNGTFVGQVIDTHIEGNKAIVELQLKNSVKPLLDDTRVRIRPQSAVGTRFIELYPGTNGNPLPNGGRIPDSQTETQIPLDTVIGTLDERRRLRLRTLMGQLGGGFAGRGEDANVALQNAPPALRSFESVAGEINAQGGLAPFVSSAQSAADAADPVRDDIALGFDPEQRALQPFVNEADSLRSVLEEAPPALSTARTELARTSPLLRQLRAFSAAAVPALAAARPAFAETTRLLDEGRAGLRELPPTLELLRPATPATLDLLRSLRPVLPRVDQALGSLLPVVTELAGRECDLKVWTGNWASAVSWGDEDTNFLRFNLVALDQTSLGGNGGDAPNIFRNPYPAPCEVLTDKASDSR